MSDQPKLETEQRGSEAYREQLKKLNALRAQFLHNWTQTDPQDQNIEAYLNEEPADFEKLGGFEILKNAVADLGNTDKEFGGDYVFAKLQKMQKLKPLNLEKHIEFFGSLFGDDRDGPYLDQTLQGINDNDIFRSSIAKLRGLVLFFKSDPKIIQQIKNRFNMQIGFRAAYDKFEIPKKLLNLLPKKEAKEVKKLTTEIEDVNSTDNVLKIEIQCGLIDKSVMLLQKEQRDKIAQTITLELEKRINESSQGKIVQKERQTRREDFERFMEEYPNPGVLIDILLKPYQSKQL